MSWSCVNVVNELVWIDLEMTGLEPKKHVIVEIATVITSADLEILQMGEDIVIGASELELSEMGEYVRNMHTKSNLLSDIENSNVTMKEAEERTIRFLDSHLPSKYNPPLCGNSIGIDRRFLAEHMPALENRMHYRCVDVTSIKELIYRWRPSILRKAPKKGKQHRAMDDILESIEELKFYKENVFNL